MIKFSPADWENVDKLMELQCTLPEIASFFRVSPAALEDIVEREKDMKYRQYYDLHKGRGQVALRRVQMQVALKGNPTMLIWLGKQYLDQLDKAVYAGRVVHERAEELSDDALVMLAMAPPALPAPDGDKKE